MSRGRVHVFVISRIQHVIVIPRARAHHLLCACNCSKVPYRGCLRRPSLAASHGNRLIGSLGEREASAGSIEGLTDDLKTVLRGNNKVQPWALGTYMTEGFARMNAPGIDTLVDQKALPQALFLLPGRPSC